MKSHVVIVLPAYNAGKTLEKTLADIPQNYRNNIILVDDYSSDEIVNLARRINLKDIKHHKNLGCSGNQKTCYKATFKEGADIVIMWHPDYQYPPQLITAMMAILETGFYYCVLFGVTHLMLRSPTRRHANCQVCGKSHSNSN